MKANIQTKAKTKCQKQVLYKWALMERTGMQILSVLVDRGCLEPCVQNALEAGFRPSKKECAEGLWEKKRDSADIWYLPSLEYNSSR